MRMRLLIVGSIVAVLLGIFGVSTSIFAAPDIGLGNGGMASGIAKQAGYDANTNDTSLASSIGKLIAAFLGLSATIFFVLTIYAGILWMTAQGNDEQVGKAQGILRMAIIGMVITMASYGITATVLILSGNSTGYSSAPPPSSGGTAGGGTQTNGGDTTSDNSAGGTVQIGGSCDTTSDCAGDYVVCDPQQGVCTKDDSCSTAAGGPGVCATGDQCVNDHCVSAGNAYGNACSSNTGCASGLCLNGACACKGASDCSSPNNYCFVNSHMCYNTASLSVDDCQAIGGAWTSGSTSCSGGKSSIGTVTGGSPCCK